MGYDIHLVKPANERNNRALANLVLNLIAHPESGAVLLPEEARRIVLDGYRARQQTVRTVAQLVEGHAVGDNQIAP